MSMRSRSRFPTDSPLVHRDSEPVQKRKRAAIRGPFVFFGEDALETDDVLDRLADRIDLRQGRILETWRVAYVSVRRRDSLYRCVQPAKAIVGHPGGDLGAVSPGDRILIDDDDAAGLPDRCVHRFVVPGRERTEVDDLGVRTARLGELVGGRE